MDTTDPEIQFDNEGHCHHCTSAIETARNVWFPDKMGEKKLFEIADAIKKECRNQEYDCIIGLSGGIDSSYLTYMVRVKLGLRPLVVHVDCGWNSEMAVKNIENITKKLDIELHTFVVNWEEMKDLQRAFFLASLPDLDIPQDHAIFAALYKYAAENNIKYALNGVNFATEIILPKSWGYQAMDLTHLRDIHKRFGTKPLRDYPTINFFQRYIFFRFVRKMKILSPLNYIDYQKDKAIEILGKELQWTYYGGKHHESRFTKFFQGYLLPVKFGYDKRRAHLSSLIVSGQISREEALEEIGQNIYTESEKDDDIEYIAKKLDWTADEFRQIISQPPKKHTDYANNEFIFNAGLGFKNILRGLTRSG